MKIIFSFGFLFFALSFCGVANKITEKIKGITNPSNSSANSNAPVISNSSSSSNSTTSSTGGNAEKPTLTAEQSAIVGSSKDMKWDDQGLSWKVPQNWKKTSSTPTSLMWSSPDSAFLIVNISPMSADFPTDASTKAFYDGAVTRKTNKEVESVRYLDLDGVKGVEFIEAMPFGKTDPRRQQWIAYRKYNGQTQMVNVMLSTTGANFEKKRDEFAAIMSTLKLDK